MGHLFGFLVAMANSANEWLLEPVPSRGFSLGPGCHCKYTNLFLMTCFKTIFKVHMLLFFFFSWERTKINVCIANSYEHFSGCVVLHLCRPDVVWCIDKRHSFCGLGRIFLIMSLSVTEVECK